MPSTRRRKIADHFLFEFHSTLPRRLAPTHFSGTFFAAVFLTVSPPLLAAHGNGVAIPIANLLLAIGDLWTWPAGEEKVVDAANESGDKALINRRMHFSERGDDSFPISGILSENPYCGSKLRDLQVTMKG